MTNKTPKFKASSSKINSPQPSGESQEEIQKARVISEDVLGHIDSSDSGDTNKGIIKGKGDCVVCTQPILNRNPKGKAITCCQKCAGVLSWEMRLG